MKITDAVMRKIEMIVIRRLHESRLDGYTKETAEEIAEAVAPMLVPDTSANIINWLRRNANAEQDPAKRAAFIEAHNAARVITARPPNTTRPND